MPAFERGTRVTVTSPEPPTPHRGGETATVLETEDHGQGLLVRIREDDGTIVVVWATELTVTAELQPS